MGKAQHVRRFSGRVTEIIAWEVEPPHGTSETSNQHESSSIGYELMNMYQERKLQWLPGLSRVRKAELHPSPYPLKLTEDAMSLWPWVYKLKEILLNFSTYSVRMRSRTPAVLLSLMTGISQAVSFIDYSPRTENTFHVYRVIQTILTPDGSCSTTY